MLLVASTSGACGSSASAPTFEPSDGGGMPADGGSVTDAGDASDPGDAGPIACPDPGTYTKNGGKCGVERWAIKTGTDPYTGSVSLVPHETTIATLAALAAAGGGTMRESPTETTLWQLTDVTLSELKLEADSDEHLVLSDGAATLIAEVPFPTCASASPWVCFISRVRGEIDARYTVGTSPQYPAAVVTVRGVGFFDTLHGQTGVAPNAIELHPVLQLCFGKGCTPT